VRNGNVLSGGGVTAGIDFVLALIVEQRGQRVAEQVQLGLEYAPRPPFNSGRPETAPPEVLDAVNVRMAPAALNDARASKPGRLLVMHELARMHDRRAFLAILGAKFAAWSVMTSTMPIHSAMAHEPGPSLKSHGETYERKRKT
jgi:transcriptional regulator GlxA family with amidase domain